MSGEDRFVLYMLAPALAILGLLVAYPVGLLVFDSFFKVDTITPHIREWVGLKNYIDAITSKRVVESAFRTLQYSVFALFFEFTFGFCAALLFSALPGQSRWHRTIFTLPLMVPPIVAGLLWRFLLVGNIGILNYGLVHLGIIRDPDAIAWLSDEDIVIYSVSFADIWLTTSFVALVSYAGLANIPQDLLEAARIDGANAFKRFWHVTLPLMRPVIAVVVIVRGVDAAKTFDLIWIQTQGGPNHASEVFSMNIYQRMVRFGDLGEASASGALFLMVMMLVAAAAYWKIWRPAHA
ncbi:sugar ABC transporter permease [Rhizobium leguminosarum bv. trifolii]|uniref:Sugar ABC transporter permease n=1 Tax=Rhizobium leguminosarum bv. trifolii TaxID=386 RepID=A0A3E1BZP6_RHILT|nr:sugar ABC transporter permease [Rhizobium leguminosarum]RFC00699.1 sugar ABC transporter permease [Rhizobium leguminosarum bv. trifolii]RFC01154.1 sugar ABC transporter permease [Rhizobium leguminosarum bv. trifolii]